MTSPQHSQPNGFQGETEGYVAGFAKENGDATEFKRITQIMMDMSHHGNPIAEKVNPEHITQVLDNADKRDARDRHERSAVRWHGTTILVIAMAFLVFLIVYLKDKPEILVPIISATFAFVAGFAGGYGYKAHAKPE